jgi:exodeoxyribonuclease V beta subunit
MNVLTDPLPDEGLLCVEASAGTGKTHLLSTLAVRWVVEHEDVRIADLLVVTYTIAAAAELRARIRSRLAEVRDRLSGGAAPEGDDYLEALARSGDAPGALERAQRALAEFDTAAISTMHGFAAAWLGDERGGVGPTEERRRQAVADVLTSAAFDPTSALFDAANLSDEDFDRVVRLAVDNPDLSLTPRDGAVADLPALAHRDAAQRAVELFESRGRRDGLRTYADLLTDLAASIRDDDAPVLRALRRRFRVGLIDEFQDTDPTQWGLFKRLFLGVPGHALVVVGDPKQAIYGFRGADVETYLEAKSTAADTSALGLGVDALDVNYRADGVLLEALNGLLDGAHLDEAQRIGYVPVDPAPAHGARRMVLADGERVVPLAIRVPTEDAPIASRRRAIAADCADEAVRVLGATIDGGDPSGRAITEDDVVVLCESSTQFPLLREAFLRRGLRTTETRSDDVARTAASLDVAVALRALRDPGDAGALAAVAHSWYGVGTGDDAAIGRLRERLAEWGRALESRGVIALGRAMTDPRSTTGLLRRRFGERALTDVLHLFDVLAAMVPNDAGPTALLEAMGELEEAAQNSGDDDVRSRRIDTDAPAIRLMSVHGAKGLEFDVVLCPFIQRTRAEDAGPIIWHDQAVGRRLLDAGGGSNWTDEALGAPTRTARAALATSAAGSESRRLLYVALTRARHRTVVWWLRAYSNADARRDELSGLLLDRDDGHSPVQRPRADREGAACYELGGSDALTVMRLHLGGLVDRGLLELGAVTTPADRIAAADAATARRLAETSELSIAELDRPLAERATRCSFSSLVADHDGTQGTLDATIGDAGADDEADQGRGDDADDGADSDEQHGAERHGSVGADPFGGLHGTAFGTAVHEALEAALRRPADAPYDDAMTASLDEALRRHGIPPSPEATAGLLAASGVAIAGGSSLRDLRGDDAVCELRFAMPVAEGIDLAAIARALSTESGNGPFDEWASALAAAGTKRPLASTLVGSVDLVTTLGGGLRHHVIDYKTNLVDPAVGYARRGLLASMRTSDYPLQAAIYLVALHRLLRWRIAGYDPERHLGNAHYLYLRGMRAGVDDGVCTWSPGAAAIARLSDVLAGAA